MHEFTNSDKTNFVVLINGHQISQVHSSKYRDLYIDDDLNWKITLNTSIVNY